MPGTRTNVRRPRPANVMPEPFAARWAAGRLRPVDRRLELVEVVHAVGVVDVGGDDDHLLADAHEVGVDHDRPLGEPPGGVDGEVLGRGPVGPARGQCRLRRPDVDQRHEQAQRCGAGGRRDGFGQRRPDQATIERDQLRREVHVPNDVSFSREHPWCAVAVPSLAIGWIFLVL